MKKLPYALFQSKHHSLHVRYKLYLSLDTIQPARLAIIVEKVEFFIDELAVRLAEDFFLVLRMDRKKSWKIELQTRHQQFKSLLSPYR